MATASIAKIFEEASKISNRDEKAAFLSKDPKAAGTIATILKMALDPTIEFDLPEGAPPYKKNELVDQEGVIYREIRKTKNLLKSSTIPYIKKQALFIEMLEKMAPEDAELFIKAKDKEHLGRGITVNVANKAFPGLINEKND